MLFGWSDLEVLDERGVEYCGPVPSGSSERSASGRGGAVLGPNATAEMAASGSLIGASVRVTGPARWVDTAADAISRPKWREPEYLTEGRGDRGVIIRSMLDQVARDERRHDDGRHSRPEMLESKAVRRLHALRFLGQRAE